MVKNKYLTLTIASLTVALLTVSCYAEIDPSAANSTAANMAVKGEYLLAILSFFFCSLISIVRIVGFVFVLRYLFNYMFEMNLMFNSNIILMVGVIFIAFFAVNIKPYKPEVYITKRKNYKQNEVKKSNSIIRDLSIGAIIAIFSLFVEYCFFAK